MAKKFELDTVGMGNILRSAGVTSMVNAAAQQIAAGAAARAPRGADVVVEPYVTDRAAARVIVKHRNAVGFESKNGMLIPAARAAGAEVRSK